MDKRKLMALGLAAAMLWQIPALAETTTAAETTPTVSAAAPASSPSPTPAPTQAPNETFDSDNAIVLKKGVSCDEVIMLQSRLRDLGYFNYKITNYYGEKTEEAVSAFQKNNGLKADGVDRKSVV